MKRLLRFYVVAFLFVDAILFLATYLLLSQARSTQGASPPDAPPAKEAAAILALPSISPTLLTIPNATPTLIILPSATPTKSPEVALTDTDMPGATSTEAPTSSATSTIAPALMATRTTPPSASPTQIPPSSATNTIQPTVTASSTPLPSPTETVQPTFTPITPTAIHDLGILSVPTLTPIQDMGILPSLTPSATRAIPTHLPVMHSVASVPTSAPPSTPAPAVQAYTSAAPDCMPHGLPVQGFLSQHFSWYHSGIDIVVPTGTTVLATQSGQVIFAGWRKDGYGNLVIIQNGRFITYYAHNSKLNVTAGQIVHASDPISLSGSTGWTTGPHVHFEVRINNVPVDPLKFDPQQYQSC